MTARLRLTLEYEGTSFHGWARQPGRRTIEGVLHDALDRTFPRWEELAVAGRTDAGVHATGQVATVQVDGGPPAERAAEALNTALPGDVAILRAEPAPPGFHARFSATSRSYRYVVHASGTRSALRARRALWWPRSIDEARLAAEAAALAGTHDFTAFTPAETAARRLRPHGAGGGLGAARRRAALHDHRRLVPAPHGALARRDDARGARARPAARRAAARRRRAHRSAVGALPRARRLRGRRPRRLVPRGAARASDLPRGARAARARRAAPARARSRPRCRRRRG